MNRVKAKYQRLVLAALTFALVWLFLLPVQAFAEEGMDASVAPQVTSTESSAGESGSADPAQTDTSGSSADVPVGSDEPTPSTQTESTETESTETESTETEPTETESTETESTETESTETESTETESTETESTETESTETESTETESTETESTETESTETESTETGSTETESTEMESTETESTETESTEMGSAETESTETEESVELELVETNTAMAQAANEAVKDEGSDAANAIQQAVDAAIEAGQKYITIVVQDGTYAGGLVIDNSGVDENGNAKESIVVNIIAHDAYTHSDAQGTTGVDPVIVGNSNSATNEIYSVPTNRDATVNTSAINTDSAGGVKLEGGVSVKNVELLIAGIYLSMKEQKENQGAIESALTDAGNVDVKVEDADNFTYYGTAKGDTANITLTDVKNTTINTGNGDDVLGINTTTSPNVELNIHKEAAELKEDFKDAGSSDTRINISTGDGNDKITVVEKSKVTNNETVVSVRKGVTSLIADACDGADTITLKGDSGIVDIKKNISEEIANKVYSIVSLDIIGHGSSAVINGGKDDDLLNLDTTWELGTMGKTKVNYQGGDGQNRLHLTGTLNDQRDDRVSGNWTVTNGSGSIAMYTNNTSSHTDYKVVDINLWLNESVTELALPSSNTMDIQMSGVTALTDYLSGKKTVNVTIEGGKVMAGEQEVVFQPFTDYVYDPDTDSVSLDSFSNNSAGGLLSKLIIKGQNLTVGQSVQIKLPGATLVLESENGIHESGNILIEGYLEADNIMLKLTSADSFAVSFVEQTKDDETSMEIDIIDFSIMDVNTSGTVTIAATAKLIAARVVDILAKSVQSGGLIPDLTDLIPGLTTLTEQETIDKYIEKIFGFKSLEMLKDAASINFVSIKMASAMVDILGNIVAGAVRVFADNQVDTTAANTALRDLGLPFALGVVLGEAGITVSDGASITANSGDIYLDAKSDIKLNTSAQSGRLPFTVAVSVVDNKAYVDINGGTLRSTHGNIIANATGTVNMKSDATGSNVRPNNNAVVPSTDNQPSNTTTHVEMGKSGGFFAISVLNQNVFSALQGTAETFAKGDITVNSTAKASVVNNATSNPGEDGESMTLAKLLKMFAGDEEVPGDGGLIGKIVNKIISHSDGKKNQTTSQEEKAAAEKQKEKKTSALGNFLNKLTGNDEKGDDVASLVDKATSSANSGKTDSTNTVQLVGALAVTYANNNNRAYIETDGEVRAEKKLSVLANGEMKVETLADGSPVKANDPASGGEKTGPQDQHFSAHSHGAVKVDALTNGTIIVDASVGETGDGTYEIVENENFPDGIDNFDSVNFIVKASFGYKLEADENGKYWITNEYVRFADNTKQTEQIEVYYVGKDADGCYIYKTVDDGYGGYKLHSGENLLKADFVTKSSITVNNSASSLGTVEVTDAQTDGKTLYFADAGEDVYVKINVRSGANFTAPYITYLVKGSETGQPVTFTEIIKGDVQEDGTVDYYYGFKMPEGNVTIGVTLTGDNMNIKLDLEDTAERNSDVWITPADKETSGEAMEADAVYAGQVGDKIKIVIQLSNNTFLVKNSLMFAGKTPVYIKDITYDGDGQYTCYVNIPAILKTEADSAAGSDLKLTFQTTVDPKEAQGTVESTSTALGAGLAVDVTNYNNQAYITKTKNNTITGGSVEVKAETAELSASAISKTGFVAGDLGVAGAITVHLVNANNEALIGGSMRSVNLTGGNLIVDSAIKTSKIVTDAEAAGDGADGKNIDPDSVGVGAGIAVGVSNLAVVSRILDTVSLGGTIGNLNINASHTGTESMAASAGASGGTSAVPVLAMNISGVSVLADSGRMLGNVLNMTGNALINAVNSITRTITADAAAVGGGVGVGASFIIDILNDSAKAKLGRSVKTNGNLTVSADSISRLKGTAKSGAKGSVSEDAKNSGTGDAGNGSGTSGEEPPPSGGSDNKVDLPDDYYEGLDNLFGDNSSDDELTEEDDPESLAPLFREGEADQFVDSNKQSAQDLSGLVANSNGNVNSQSVGDAFENRQKAETSEGSVQVAATMVLNIQNNTALAQIDAVNSIDVGGKVTVSTRHDTDGVIMADASATKSTTGVGVAVAINTVTYSNIAEILSDKIKASEIVVSATVYEAEAKKTAEGFFEAIKNDVLNSGEKIKKFIDDVLAASEKGNLLTFIRTYLGNYAVENAAEIENGVLQLIVQWVGELLQGKTPSFPTSEQENKIKSQVSKYAKEIFDKVKKDFTVKKLKEQLFGKDSALGNLKKNVKNLTLKEQATNALISYLSGKLGGNDEAEAVGPRISTSAASGAGASNVGVAGSLAISVVNGESKAQIADAKNGEMNVADGKITITSKASQDVHTSAGASVDAIGRVDKNKSATDSANSTQGTASNADSGKSVGVGAAVAMSFAELTSDAGIGSGWTVLAKDLAMSSEAENDVETTGVSGTDPLARTEKPTDKPDKELTEEEKKEKEKKEAEEKAAQAMDYAVDASVSVTLIQNSVKAYLAENSVITLSGNLNMLSSQSGETNTNASGFAMGNETAVGAAVAINLAFSDVLTQLLGSGSVVGSASLDSKTENQDDANALALAMGAEMERYVAKLKNSEKVMAFNKKKEEENKKDEKIENKTANKVSTQLKRASKVSDKEDEDKSDPSQPLSVQAIKSQNVKTESTNQTDAGKNNSVGSTVTDATNANTGNAVSGTLNGQAQEGQSIHVAASVGVNVTEHSAKTEIKGNLTVGGLKAEVENNGNFTTASTGAAISEATNSNCVGAAVAVSVNGNKALIEIADGIQIVVTGTPVSGTEKDTDSILGNVALSTVLNQNSTGDALGKYGVLAISGSSSGKGGKVGLAGSVAVLVAKGTSAIILGNNVTVSGNEKGSVSIEASDKSKLSAAAMAATKSGGAAAGVGASFALLYAKNEVLAQAGDNFFVSAKDFTMTATKQAVDITDFKPDTAVSDFLTVLEVDSKGNGGYKTDDADKYGMIVLQKNQNGSYSVFTNLDTASMLELIQLTSVLASVNYYASAVAGTVMERKGDTSNQKAAVAGAVSMLFNDSVTSVIIGNNAKITTAGDAHMEASGKTNTRLLGGALSSSGAKAGIGLNVATAKQNDKVFAAIGNAPVITAGNFRMNVESISDMLVITAAAVNANGTSVGGTLNVVINDTGATASVGNNANISASNSVEILSNVQSNIALGSVTVAISGGQDQGASAGAIVSVTTNASASEATVGDNADITGNSGTITISAINEEQVISVLAAAARSGYGGAGAGTLSILTTDAKTVAGVGDNAKLTAANDITVTAIGNAMLIDLMLAAAASTDAPAVGATIMVNVFNRETNAYIGDNSVIVSKLGNVLVQADSKETAVIVSIAGAAAENAISGNIQVNVGNSKTYATIGDNANIKAWDSIGVTANQDSTVVAISPTVSYGSNSTAVGATVQTNVLGSEVKAIIGQNANLIAYAQPSVTNGVQTTNRETKRKGIILSALAKDLVVAGGVSASAGKNAAAGVVETMVNKTVVIAKLGANAVVRTGFQSGDTVDSAFSGNTPSDKEGELSAEADAHSTLVLFGGAFSATSSTGVGATVLTLAYDKNVDAQILLSTTTPSNVHGNVTVSANAEDLVALVSVNFGVSTDTAANVGGNVLIFQDKVNANLTGNLIASGDVTVQAESIVDLINAIASVSGGLGGTAVSGAALVTYFQGTTTASVGAKSQISCADLKVLATSTADIDSDGVGLSASVGSAAVSGLVNIIVTSTETKACVDYGTTVKADNITVIATDNYDLLAIAASLSGGFNGVGVTAVVTVAKNMVLAYIGDNSTIQSAALTVKAISNRNIRNYAGSVAAGATAGAGVTVMTAVIGGMLDQDSANGIEKGFKPDVFMNGISDAAPNVAKDYLLNTDLSADIAADDAKASDLHVGDENGNYTGADDYRSDDFDQDYNSGTNPGETFSDDVTNTQGSELGMAKPEGEYRNVVNAYIGSNSKITVSGATLIEASEKLNVDIITAAAAVGGTAGINVGVAVVVAYSNVLAEVRKGTLLNCADITVHAISGGDGSIENDKASEVLEAAGIDAPTDGSSIRAIAITVGIGGTAGVSPSVAVVNMASSAIARMDGVSGSADIITVKAETVYPNVLSVTGAIGVGGTAGISASVAVVTFNSNTYAGITDSELRAAKLNILSNVDNTARAFAMSLAGGAVGVNGGVAVVANRSTTETILAKGKYTISGDADIHAVVNTNAESYIVGVALGGIAVGLNAAVVNQHANIVTQILGDSASSLTASGNVTVSNDITSTAKSAVSAVAGGGVGVGGNVLLVFNNMEAIAAIINVPFNVNGNVTVRTGMNANSEATLAAATLGGVAVGLSTSYVGLNAKNLAYLELAKNAVAKAASIRVYAGSADDKNSFNATASTVAGGAGAVNVGLNAAVADINATNEAKILSKGTLTGGVDVQANSTAAALAEIYFASAGGVNVSAATAVSLLRINQLAEADVASIDNFNQFNVSAVLNDGSQSKASYAKVVTISGGMYNASANVAVAYTLSQNIAQATIGTGTNGNYITVNSSGAADATSDTLNQSAGAFSGSVFVNVAYAKGQFQSVLKILDQVSARSVAVQTTYNTSAYANLTPSASKMDLSLASFNVNLAIAKAAANALASLEGGGKLDVNYILLVQADGRNSVAYANITGATVEGSGFSFGVNVADSQMALEQTARVDQITAKTTYGNIDVNSYADYLTSTAQTGANGGKGSGFSIVGGNTNSATANVSVINQAVVNFADLSTLTDSRQQIMIRATGDKLNVNAQANELNFELRGISAAIITTDATVTKFNNGVFLNNSNISSRKVGVIATARETSVNSQSSVPSFSGAIVGTQSVVASAEIVEKLTQVIMNSGTITNSGYPNLEISVYADANLEADSAHPSSSAGAITVQDYQFTIDVGKILTEIQINGQLISYPNVILTAEDKITGNITMDSSTIGAFTGVSGIANINVENQTAYIKVAGDITTDYGDIYIEAWADQQLSAHVDIASTSAISYGYAQTDIFLNRNAIVDIDGNLISKYKNIEIYANLGTLDTSKIVHPEDPDHVDNTVDKVIDLYLNMNLHSLIDTAPYPTGTAKLVSVAQVNVAEGSLIQAVEVMEWGFVTISAKSEGAVQVYVNRTAGKLFGNDGADSVADVNETVNINIGGDAKTRILGRDVDILAQVNTYVASVSETYVTTTLGVFHPKATVIFCVDVDVNIRSTDISALYYTKIAAEVPYAYVLGHCISRKFSISTYNSPSVNIKGNIYGDVTIDNNTAIRTQVFNVRTFQPAAKNADTVTIKRLAESFIGSLKTTTDENTVFRTSDAWAYYRGPEKDWNKFSTEAKFLSGTYNPDISNENNVYYSGKLTWSAPSVSGETTPSGQTEIYLGSLATGVYVKLEGSRATVWGADSLVTFEDGVFHVDGSKLNGVGYEGATNAGSHNFKVDTTNSDYLMVNNATSGSLTLFNYSQYDVQLDNVNQSDSHHGAYLNVTHKYNGYDGKTADLIFNGGGNYSNGSIYVNMDGGDLKLLPGSEINAQNIVVHGAGSILDENRDDGRVVITNSGYTGNLNESSIRIAVKGALNLILQTINPSYTINRIQSNGDLTLEVVNTLDNRVAVVLGELISNGNVTITVPGSVESADPSQVNITGNTIVLNAGGNVGTSSQHLRIDSSANQTSGVTVTGSGGIYLNEVNGDLYITEIRNDDSGNIAIWTEDGSIYAYPDTLTSDTMELLNEHLMEYVEAGVIVDDAEEMIKLLVQYMRDLIQIRNTLETESVSALETVKQKVDILNYVTSVDEALEIIAEELLAIGGTDYQDPDIAEALMNSALVEGELTEEFIAVVDRFTENPDLAGMIGEYMVTWRGNYDKMTVSLFAALLFRIVLAQKLTHISGDGDLHLHLQSSTGTASVSHEDGSLTISVGGKVTITSDQDTVVENVYLESHKELKLDPIVATDVIDLYSMNGIYAANQGDQVLLDADSVMLWSMLDGDLGTEAQTLILNTNLLNAFGNNVYLENSKDLEVDKLLAKETLNLTVQGNLNDLRDDDTVLNGIEGKKVNLQVSGDIGSRGNNVSISSDGAINITAQNLYTSSNGDVYVGTITTDHTTNIEANKGSILNAEEGTGIWCDSLNLEAYGMIGTEGDRLRIHSDSELDPNGGVMRSLYRASAQATDTLLVNSYLYNENLEIIPLTNDDENEDDEDVGDNESEPTTDPADKHTGGTSFITTTDTYNNGEIRISGQMAKGTVLTVTNLSEHVDCTACLQMMQYQGDGQIFVNLTLTGEYAGKLLVQIPATGKLAEYEGQEIVILTCRDGKIWAIRATVIDGIITFYTDELGSFLILADPAQLELTAEGTQILLGQESLPFGGWL